jgi:FtsP/CotA-like multicopper oxidase with cupredoxin domain
MYFNVFGEKVSRARYREMINAQKNRRELIAARLSRRDLFKMGLLTGAGYLVAKNGLSARAQGPTPEVQPASPPTRSFIEPMPIMPIKEPVPRHRLQPAPSVNPLPGEGRTRPFQSLTQFPPEVFYEIEQRATLRRVSPDLPLQRLWGFDGEVPGPTYVAHYGKPALVRNFNRLPKDSPDADGDNDGFGIPSVSTHLHNGHTPSESDGFPCDFFEVGQFYDQHYPNVLAGILSTHPGTGDINEALSTLWYHDHRVDFTSQNVYKGLAGFYLLFNEFDTGHEHRGFRLPKFPEFDVPMFFSDKVFDEDGSLFFDLFNLDGILGDRFLVNGKIQPFFRVKPRRYRFRWLNGGPSRFYEFFLTDREDLDAHNTFWVLANDGNVLPQMALTESVRIGVAERMDVIIDFSKFRGRRVFLENRLAQTNGQGPPEPPNDILPAGQGNFVLRFDVDDDRVDDDSVEPALFKGYDLPDTTEAPAVVRNFRFDRLNGQWSINGTFMDCNRIRFTVKQNTAEHWVLTNFSGDWTHPIHIHLEEHQILTRNRKETPFNYEIARKDVVKLRQNERVELFFRFRDWTGRYPLHCHNTVHEDHAMMMRWEIQPDGDTNITP